MRRNIYILISFIVSVAFIHACGQEQPFRQRRSPSETAAYLKDKLDLTDAQKTEIQKILEEQRDQMEELRGSFSGDREKMREVMRELRDETDHKIEELLSDDQKAKYDEIKNERRQNMRDRLGGRER